jgi:hypothetical protein
MERTGLPKVLCFIFIRQKMVYYNFFCCADRRRIRSRVGVGWNGTIGKVGGGSDELPRGDGVGPDFNYLRGRGLDPDADACLTLVTYLYVLLSTGNYQIP